MRLRATSDVVAITFAAAVLCATSAAASARPGPGATASFGGRTINLADGWGQAVASATDGQATTCFRSEADMEAHLASTAAPTPAAGEPRSSRRAQPRCASTTGPTTRRRCYPCRVVACGPTCRAMASTTEPAPIASVSAPRTSRSTPVAAAPGTPGTPRPECRQHRCSAAGTTASRASTSRSCKRTPRPDFYYTVSTSGHANIWWKVCKERQNDPDICSSVRSDAV